MKSEISSLGRTEVYSRCLGCLEGGLYIVAFAGAGEASSFSQDRAGDGN